MGSLCAYLRLHPGRAVAHLTARNASGGHDTRRTACRVTRPGDPEPPPRRGIPAPSGAAGSLSRRDPDAPRPQRRRVRARRLLRPQPAGPGGPGGRPQAPGHVHRVHRLAGPDALRVGDHRQLRRRGARRPLHAHRGRPARGRLGRGARRRPGHPGRHRAAHRPGRGRGGHDPAPRRREVRRWLLRRLGRAARGGGLRGQRAGGPAGRRGRPGRQDPRHELPAWGPRHVRQRRPRVAVRAGLRRPRARQGHEEAHRDPHPLLGGPAGLPQGRLDLPRRAAQPGPSDRFPRARPDPRRPRRARSGGRRAAVPLRRRHQRVLRVPRSRPARQRRAPAARGRALQGDRAGPRRQGPHDAAGGRARPHRRHRAAVGHRLRHGGPLVRQHHRDAQGRHPHPGLRAGAHQDA